MDDIPLFPGVDKVVHFCMYGGMSGMLWLEFLRNHRKYETVLWHAWIGAVLCPIVMSGIIEILQEYCTTYRGGDWFWFLGEYLRGDRRYGIRLVRASPLDCEGAKIM